MKGAVAKSVDPKGEPFQIYTTNISFWVNVPVLSVQITWAEPIVSQQLSCLTKLFYFNICLTEKAKESVTASGSPSGTATTIITTASIK